MRTNLQRAAQEVDFARLYSLLHPSSKIGTDGNAVQAPV